MIVDFLPRLAGAALAAAILTDDATTAAQISGTADCEVLRDLVLILTGGLLIRGKLPDWRAMLGSSSSSSSSEKKDDGGSTS